MGAPTAHDSKQAGRQQHQRASTAGAAPGVGAGGKYRSGARADVRREEEGEGDSWAGRQAGRQSLPPCEDKILMRLARCRLSGLLLCGYAVPHAGAATTRLLRPCPPCHLLLCLLSSLRAAAAALQ